MTDLQYRVQCRVSNFVQLTGTRFSIQEHLSCMHACARILTCIMQIFFYLRLKNIFFTHLWISSKRTICQQVRAGSEMTVKALVLKPFNIRTQIETSGLKFVIHYLSGTCPIHIRASPKGLQTHFMAHLGPDP